MDHIQNLHLNFVDIAVFGVVLLSMLLSWRRGFAHEVLRVTAWVTAVFATLWLFPWAKGIAMAYISFPLVAKVVAASGVFIAVLVSVSLLTNALGNVIRDKVLGHLDRSLGLLFGVARAGIIISLLWMGWAFLFPDDPIPEWAQKSKTLPLVRNGATAIISSVPSHYNLSLPGSSAKPLNPSAQDLIAPVPDVTVREMLDGYSEIERLQLDRLFDNNIMGEPSKPDNQSNPSR